MLVPVAFYKKKDRHIKEKKIVLPLDCTRDIFETRSLPLSIGIGEGFIERRTRNKVKIVHHWYRTVIATKQRVTGKKRGQLMPKF